MTKHKLCTWCGEMLFKSKEHQCPKIFIHKLNDKEVTIRCDFLDLKWKGKKIIIWNKESDSKGET